MPLTIRKTENKLVFDLDADNSCFSAPILHLNLLARFAEDEKVVLISFEEDGSVCTATTPEESAPLPLLIHLRDRVCIPYSDGAREGMVVEIQDEDNEDCGLILEANLRSPDVSIRVFLDNGQLVREGWADWPESEPEGPIQVLS